MTPRELLDPAAIKRKLAGVGPEGLAKRAGWAGMVEILQVISSVLVFLFLARLLTTEDYGVMGAVLGIAVTTASLSNLGSQVLLIKRSAQGEDLQQAWGRATSVGICGPALGALVLLGLKPIFLPEVDFWVYGLLVVSQLNFFWLTELAVFLGNGTRRLKEAAQMRLIVVTCRFSALVLFAVFGGGSLFGWAFASATSFGVAALVCLYFVWRVFGLVPAVTSVGWGDVVEGAPYSANSGSEGLVDVSDRPLLVRFGHSEDAGIYALGGRIIQFGYVPIRILLRASDADMFQAGKRGVGPALGVTRSLLKPGIAVGVAVGVGVLIFAPIVPLLVGDKFADAVATMRWLAVMPAIRSVQYLMGNCLTVSGLQWWRVRTTLSAAALNFGLNLWLLPTGTWRTAVFTTIVSEVFLALAMTVVVLSRVRAERRQADPAVPA